MFTPDQINAQLEIPEGSSTPVTPAEAAFMYRFIQERGISRTLETGMGYARSAAHIIVASTGTKHVAMDPFQAAYDNGGLRNLERLGLSNRLDFHADHSHSVLPRLLAAGDRFDFIFIDGDHKFDGEFIDFYYADLLLSNGGYLLLHDTWMRSTAFVMSFIETNRKDYACITTGLPNFAMYRKVGDDQRDWLHFAEFYTFKSLLSHSVVPWLYGGQRTALKRLIRWALG